MGKLAAQTLVVLPGGGEPHSVVFYLFLLFAKHEDNFVSNVNREAAEHGAGFDRKLGDGVEHKRIGRRLAGFDREWVLVC